MTRMRNITVPATLLFSALLLSGCASKSEPTPVAAPVEVVAEKPAVVEAAPAPATAAVAEQPQATTQAAPKKPKARKAKKVAAKKVEPVAPPPPAPAPAPAPVVEQAAPVVVAPEPAPPVVVAPPVKEEAGFLEQYWMWLLGLLVVIAGVVFWRLKNRD